MATKTIINCMDNSVISPSQQGISIIIDQPNDNSKSQPAFECSTQSSNIIKIQHACDQAPAPAQHLLLLSTASTTLNNKTLIDINRNNDHHHHHHNNAEPSKDHVLQINCTTSNEISREIKENSNTLTKLEYNSITDDEELQITNGNATTTNHKDHNEEEKLDLKEEEEEIVKNVEEDNGDDKELTKYKQLPHHNHSPEDDEEESGQTTSQHEAKQQQQVNNGNSKCRENGHFTQNHSSNKLEHNNDHNERPHNHNHQTNSEDDDDDHDDGNDHHDHRYEKDHNNEVTSIGEDISVKRVNDFSHAKRPFNEENSNSLITKADAFTTTTLTINHKLTTQNHKSKINSTNNNNNSNNNNTTKIQENYKDLENLKNLNGDLVENHVVKIQIKPNKLQTERKQITVVKIENLEKQQKQQTDIEKKVEIKENIVDNFTGQEIPQESVLKINEKMVQKPSNNNKNNNILNTVTVSNTMLTSSNSNSTNGNATVSGSTGSTTVTELNVSSSNYLYYMMSSGQFSPCDTLDSGTGSDLESNGQQQQSSPPSLLTKMSSNTCLAPLEMHIKSTKIRVSNTLKSKDLQQRQCSFTDSEESEASSLSCDSLHSNEFLRQQSTSPTSIKASNKKIQTLLPDSLLREIKNLKFSSNDYEAENEEEEDMLPQLKNSHNLINKTKNYATENTYETINTQDYVNSQSEYMQALNNLKNHSSSSSLKRASLPSKTFVLNAEDGTFIDTKMNSMPRTYEADKYYNFHVHEHDNFRSFGNNSSASINGDGDSMSISDYDTKSLQDDVFAGYRDIRCSSNTSTIRSSKGTVRGVKNRVRNGIATFLQLQEPNVKNFKEKDSGKVVLYTTSMGIIRDTYAKCSNVKQILRTLLVKFEERDVFMSVEYQQEIKERMHSDIIKVPQLYVEGQHIGDADTVERLNESGELRQLLKPYKSISTTYTCQTCGGYRLLPCPSCNGSKKSVHRNHFTAEFVALKCMNCDEVGLVKCHNC